MLKQKRGVYQPDPRGHVTSYRRRLRWQIIWAVARFHTMNPQWSEYFFDVNFLLNRGLPVVERHVAGVSNCAIELALAWAEEWPAMNANQRKACLQAQTVIAAELLQLVTEAMLGQRPAAQNAVQVEVASWRGVGVPLTYLQSHNPPTRATDLLSSVK